MEDPVPSTKVSNQSRKSQTNIQTKMEMTILRKMDQVLEAQHLNQVPNHYPMEKPTLKNIQNKTKLKTRSKIGERTISPQQTSSKKAK